MLTSVEKYISTDMVLILHSLSKYLYDHVDICFNSISMGICFC